METRLLPCPFCGEEAKAYETNIGMDCPCWWNVECTVCEATMEGFGSERIAIRAWNTRHERTCKQVLTECNDGLMPPFRAYCGECGNEWGFTPNFCPNCGAKVVH